MRATPRSPTAPLVDEGRAFQTPNMPASLTIVRVEQLARARIDERLTAIELAVRRRMQRFSGVLRGSDGQNRDAIRSVFMFRDSPLE